jgi:prepilin-type processing-associated H-X9-DG protein
MVAGTPIYQYHRDDVGGENVFIAQAQELGYASSNDLAAALGRSPRTMHRLHQFFREDGTGAILPKKPGRPKGQALSKTDDDTIRRLHGQNKSGRQIARHLMKAPATVQKAMRRMGLAPKPPTRPDQRQPSLFDPKGEQKTETTTSPTSSSHTPSEPHAVEEPHGSSVSCVAGGRTLDADPKDRSIDRMLAFRGLLHDATPLFALNTEIPRLGVLLAVPLLVQTGLFEEASRLYGSIGPAFYGLRTSLLTLMVLHLLRVKHPENLKEYSPPELGMVLGLDRAPEVKTLRRKLAELTAGPMDTLLERLVQRRVDTHSEAMGFLYVDGHVRVYNGRHKLPKTHVARMRLSLPATQDVWVNDAQGSPVFVVTQRAHPSLVRALSSLLPNIRDLVGQRRVTMVFDRGGWSPQLFKKMYDAGFDVITYRKGLREQVEETEFTRHEVPHSAGRAHWELHDMQVVLSNGLKMRQVTRLRGTHQTQVLTTRTDLPAAEVAYRMFERWRQENFFKYMRQEYAIDALVQYGAEPDDPTRDVPNPAWSTANKELNKAKLALRRLEADYGEAARNNPDKQRPTMQGFRSANATEIGIPMRAAKARVDELKAARNAHPRRVMVGELEQPPVRLLSARKRLSDGLKMLAYQVETDLVRAIAPHYARAVHEGRTLICAALQSRGQLSVVGGELRVTLAAQSSAHRSKALARLCTTLNKTRTLFPGTKLILCFTVEGFEDS